MPGKTRTETYVPDFETAVRDLQDEQLKHVLKRRKLYQDSYAKAAIREAIKRELISEEDDLQAFEIIDEPLKMRLFPNIENPKNKEKIRRSVGRGLLLAGLLPAIWGLVRLNSGFSTEGILNLISGAGWMGISAWLIRTYSVLAVRILMVLLVLSLVYVSSLILNATQLVFMDLFIVTVLYLMIAYGLLFLLRLYTGR